MAKNVTNAKSPASNKPKIVQHPTDAETNVLRQAVEARENDDVFYVAKTDTNVGYWLNGVPGAPFLVFKDDLKQGAATGCRATDNGMSYYRNLFPLAVDNQGDGDGDNDTDDDPDDETETGDETGEYAGTEAGDDEFPIFGDKPIPEFGLKGVRVVPANYPFDRLEVGKYFWVPANENRPNPIKLLSPIVTKRNKMEDAPAQFRCKTIKEGNKENRVIKGVEVWRIS